MANNVKSFRVQGQDYGVSADLSFDGFPTLGSTNPVTSNGIAVAIQGATLGDNISFGRTDTPVGYCSVAYGDNVTSTGDYSIVFGYNNTSYCKETFIVGGNNEALYGYTNILMGSQNYVSGYYNTASGVGNISGIKIPKEFSGIDLNDPDRKIYFGYVIPSTKKIYYDPEHTSEMTFSFTESFKCYWVDLTTGIDSQPTGLFYEAKFVYRSRTLTISTLTPVIDLYVDLVDAAANAQYIYRGISYYDPATDKNYADSAHTQIIDTTSAAYLRPNIGDTYLDMHSQVLVVCNGKMGERPYNTLNWAKKKLYKGSIGSDYLFKGSKHGRQAYVKSDTSDQSTVYKVYLSPDYSTSNEITNQITDGEWVVDISGSGIYYYGFDINHNLYSVKKIDQTNGQYYSPAGGNVSSGSITIGKYNYTTGNQGSIVCGQNNEARLCSEGSAIFGGNNVLELGYRTSGQARTFMAGSNNSIKTHSGRAHTFMAVGQDNNIDLRIASNCDRNFVTGAINYIYGDGGFDVILEGSYNYLWDGSVSNIYGRNNNCYGFQDAYVLGMYNVIGKSYVRMTMGSDGIWTGDGISYDAVNKIYTFPTGKILQMVRRVTTIGSAPRSSTDARQEVAVGYAISTDGHNLTTISTTGSRTLSQCFMIGNYNQLLEHDFTAVPSSYNIINGCIFGAFNTVYWKRDGTIEGINVLGYHLTIDYDDTTPVQGAVYLGTYNSMGETTNAQLVVGIGTSSAGANGFIVYKNGITAAPACPSSMNGASTAAAADGIDANKVLVTVGMMQDYTAPGGGGSSRPTVTTLTLAVADWDSFELTESLPNITENSIVIIQPSGNPHAFYTDEIYLKSQGEDEVTFGCSVVPSVDITVKVVYWA
jgi:hypothetical protein